MLSITCLVSLFVGVASQADPVVDLDGRASVRGIVEYVPNTNKPIYGFMGIPYAQPPLDNLRFSPPQPAALWAGERDATDFGDVCAQSVFEDGASEDCLFLNIRTPSLDPRANLTVMVWIHGGAMQFGAGDRFTGTQLASYEDVVVVSLNYRLGVLGFFTTGDAISPGNMGMMDQQMALRWVQTHIRRFGGDPDEVTIFGESAGSTSVSFQVVSPMSRGLFKRAISESGTAIGPNRVQPYPVAVNMSRDIADDLDCEWTSSADVVACLRLLDWQDIAYHTTAHQPYPTIDGVYMPDWPFNLYNTGNFTPVDYMVGFNKDEGWFFTQFADTDVDTIRDWFENFLENQYPQNTQAIVDATMRLYVDLNNNSADHYDIAFNNLVSDVIFIGPSNDIARKHVVRNPNVYMYHFNHRPAISNDPEWVTAIHADELAYVFGAPFSAIGDDFSEQGRTLSGQMMKYWANFAKTGNPNSAGLPAWPRVTCQNLEYMELVPNPYPSRNYEPARMQFWMETIHTLDAYRSPYFRGYPWSCPSNNQ